MSLPRYYCPKCRMLIATEYESFIKQIALHVEQRPLCKKRLLQEQAKWEKEQAAAEKKDTRRSMIAPNNPHANPDDLAQRIIRDMKTPKGGSQ